MEVHRNRLAKFHEAIFNAEVSTVNRLLAKGVSVNATYKGETAFTLATACLVVDQRHGYADPDRRTAREFIAEAIFQDPNIDPKARSNKKRTALHEAASVGRVDWLDRLLGLGARVDKADMEGQTPVSIAVREDKASCLERMILLAGVDVNQHTKHERSLLHLAYLHLSCEVIRVLLKYGCKVNTTFNDGENPLLVVYRSWHKFDLTLLPKWLEITDLLIEAGCDINARDFQGKTLLENMVERNNVYGVYVLAERGCDVGLKDSCGLTFVQSAICRGHHEVAKCLLHYGSRWEEDLPHGEALGRNVETLSASSMILSVINSFKKLHNTHTEELIYSLLESAHFSVYCNDLDPLVEAIEAESERLQTSSESDIHQKRLEEIKEELEELVLGLYRSPLSLQHQSKVRIRDALGATNVLSKIDRLPLPTVLKRFINLGVALNESNLSESVRLHAAVMAGKPDEVRRSIEAGGDVQVTLGGHSALDIAFHSASDEVIHELFQHLCSRPMNFPATYPSSIASLYNLPPSSSTSQQLIRKPTVIYFSDMRDTALHFVARTSRLRFVETAIRLSPEQLYTRNTEGRTCLEEAILGGTYRSIITAEAILLRGAVELSCVRFEPAVENIALRDIGVTLLHLASAAGALSLVKMLLDSPFCTPNCTDMFGYTPLQIAASQGKKYQVLERSPTNSQIQDLVLFISQIQTETRQYELVVKTLIEQDARG